MKHALPQLLHKGLIRLQQHSELWFVGVLVIVLPLLYLFLMQYTLSAALQNAITTEKTKIAAIQDTLEAQLYLFQDEEERKASVAPIFQTLSARNPDIVSLQLVKEVDGELTRLVDQTGVKNEPVSDTNGWYRTALSHVGQSFIFEFRIGEVRQWQVYRALKSTGGTQYYLFSEHNLAAMDARLGERVAASYIVLACIVLFLLAFGYWTTRQIDYRTRYQEAVATIKEHELFTSSIVHELRAPLTAMRGYASMIEEAKNVPPAITVYGTQIKQSTIRLVALISDYLEVTRLRAGAEKVVLAPISLRETLDAVVKELTPSANEKHLTITVTPAPNVILPSNQKFLTQIFTNLISNAIKYTPHGHVAVTIDDGPYAAEVRIKDTGTGMSAEDQARLFAPFSRVGNAESKNITGSGLGMWITKLMVEQLGGSIGVESIKGIGTHVVVRFKKAMK